jgi:hypothetical protein
MASEQQPKRTRGGQPKPPDQRKRNNVTIRMRDDLRDKVERAAAAAGRSMGQQIAHTLAEAFATRPGYAEIDAKLDTLTQAIERLAAVPPSLPSVMAGPPSPTPVKAGGPPSMKEMFAPIAPPPPEPYPQPLRLVVNYTPPPRWTDTPVVTINQLDGEAA